MASREPKGEPRKVVTSYKLSVTEHQHLRQVAAARGMTAGQIVREALRKEGALPS